MVSHAGATNTRPVDFVALAPMKRSGRKCSPQVSPNQPTRAKAVSNGSTAAPRALAAAPSSHCLVPLLLCWPWMFTAQHGNRINRADEWPAITALDPAGTHKPFGRRRCGGPKNVGHQPDDGVFDLLRHVIWPRFVHPRVGRIEHLPRRSRACHPAAAAAV